MREFKEIKEEILGRSKKRIIRRKRIISASVTLCVCFIVGITAFVLKTPEAKKPDEKPDATEDYSFLTEESMDDTEAITVEIVKITYGEKEYTSKTDIVKISNSVSNIIGLSANRGGSVHIESDSLTADDADSQIKDVSAKKLGFYDEYGQYEEFIIEGNYLKNVQTGASYGLSEKQRSDLLELLN